MDADVAMQEVRKEIRRIIFDPDECHIVLRNDVVFTVVQRIDTADDKVLLRSLCNRIGEVYREVCPYSWNLPRKNTSRTIRSALEELKPADPYMFVYHCGGFCGYFSNQTDMIMFRMILPMAE